MFLSSYHAIINFLTISNFIAPYQDLIPGLRSEVMVIELVQRLIRLAYLCTEVASLVGFEVLKSDGKVGAQYSKSFGNLLKTLAKTPFPFQHWTSPRPR